MIALQGQIAFFFFFLCNSEVLTTYFWAVFNVATPKKRKWVSLAVKLDIVKDIESEQGPMETVHDLDCSVIVFYFISWLFTWCCTPMLVSNIREYLRMWCQEPISLCLFILNGGNRTLVENMGLTPADSHKYGHHQPVAIYLWGSREHLQLLLIVCYFGMR